MQAHYLPNHDSGFRRTFTLLDSILASMVAEEVGCSASAEEVKEAWPVLEDDIVHIINRAATLCQVRLEQSTSDTNRCREVGLGRTPG